MVDETPRILHGQAGDSIELYAFSAYLWKGVQELIDINQDLILKNANLEARIAELESKLS